MVVVAVLIVLGSVAAMIGSTYGASGFPVGGWRIWVLYAQSGFGPPEQLGLLLAGVLLMIDARAADRFPGQRGLFAGVGLLGLAGATENIAGIVANLTLEGISSAPAGITAEAWTITIAAGLSSAVLASMVCVIGTAGWHRLVRRGDAGDE